ncbi:MAG: archaetidylserine decarboxylase [Pseudomonadales bacterium]|nr:archaetidylserine decarboxylase [Pseudomonadales bacterium]
MRATVFIIVQYLVPHHFLSRLAGFFASSTRPGFKNFIIGAFIRHYGVNMAEALQPDPEGFDCFNDFFTRALKPDARPVAADPATIVSPADGLLSAIGVIRAGQLLQAKNKRFSLAALLGGSEARARPFLAGSFATVYLSPRDYHRVHMPCAGTLTEMVFIPGRLFSVNQTTSDKIPDLFARNERVVCLFDTALGPMAVVLVGAMIVASIETVWAGQVAPGTRQPACTDYRAQQPPIHLEKGQEMGRFKLGSTAIVLFGPGAVTWSAQLESQSAVRMGEALGHIL